MSDKYVIKNAADEEQVKQARGRASRIRECEVGDMRYILASPQGRRFVWRYLGECGVFQSSFTGNSSTFFKEGERNIGLKLLTDVNEASPEAYVTMMKESKGNQDA